MIFALVVAAWFLTSTLLSAYNKWLFSQSQQGIVVYPLLSTSYQMLVQFVIIVIVHLIRRLSLKLQANRVYFRLCVPTALSTSLDIGLSNLSLSYVTLSTYTVLKSTAPLFILLVGVFLKAEVAVPDQVATDNSVWQFLIKWRRYVMVICGVMFGVTMMAIDEGQGVSQHDSSLLAIFGMFLVLMASFMSGVRWALTERMLMGLTTDSSEYHELADEQSDVSIQLSPVAEEDETQKLQILYLLTPLMCVSLFILSNLIEWPFSNTPSPHLHKFPKDVSQALAAVYLTIPAPLAIIMLFIELTVLSMSSPFQLSLMGMVKECAGVLTGLLLFHDKVGLLGWLGIVVVLSSVWLFHHTKVIVNRA